MSSAAMDVAELEARLRAARVVPVLRTGDASAAHDLVARLLDAGLAVLELTTTIPGWEEVTRAVREQHPDVGLGVGTIRSAEDARRAIAAGAGFCVSPHLVPAARPVLDAAGVPFVEGGLTPTEVLEAAGRGIAKLFPAHVGGVGFLKSVLSVAPDARIVPTGGIPLEDVPRWLDAGALAVGVGSDLCAPGDVGARVRRALGG